MRCPYVQTRQNGKLVRIHRLVAEQMLGRPLRDDECVHHIDGDGHNNRPENLEILSVHEHPKRHAKYSSPEDKRLARCAWRAEHRELLRARNRANYYADLEKSRQWGRDNMRRRRSKLNGG